MLEDICMGTDIGLQRSGTCFRRQLALGACPAKSWKRSAATSSFQAAPTWNQPKLAPGKAM